MPTWIPLHTSAPNAVVNRALNTYLAELDAERAKSLEAAEFMARELARHASALQSQRRTPLRVVTIRNQDYPIRPTDEMVVIANTTSDPIIVTMADVVREELGRELLIYVFAASDDGVVSIVPREGQALGEESADNPLDVTFPHTSLRFVSYAHSDPKTWLLTSSA